MSASPEVLHRRRILAWLLLVILAVAVVALTGSWLTPNTDGRHLFAVAAAAGLVVETEWKP